MSTLLFVRALLRAEIATSKQLRFPTVLTVLRTYRTNSSDIPFVRRRQQQEMPGDERSHRILWAGHVT